MFYSPVIPNHIPPDISSNCKFVGIIEDTQLLNEPNSEYKKGDFVIIRGTGKGYLLSEDLDESDNFRSTLSPKLSPKWIEVDIASLASSMPLASSSSSNTHNNTSGSSFYEEVLEEKRKAIKEFFELEELIKNLYNRRTAAYVTFKDLFEGEKNRCLSKMDTLDNIINTYNFSKEEKG